MKTGLSDGRTAKPLGHAPQFPPGESACLQRVLGRKCGARPGFRLFRPLAEEAGGGGFQDDVDGPGDEDGHEGFGEGEFS